MQNEVNQANDRPSSNGPRSTNSEHTSLSEAQLGQDQSTSPTRLGRKKVIAFGDNHGCDPALLEEDLVQHEVCEPNGQVRADFDGYILQIGDTVDRGAYSREVFDFWRDLQRNTPDQVIRLLGNHELYHLVGCPEAIRAKHIEGLQQDLIDDILAEKLLAAWREGDMLYTHAGLDLKMFPEYCGIDLDVIVADLNQRLVEMARKVVVVTRQQNAGLIEQNLDLLDSDPIFSAGPYGNGVGGGIFWARQEMETDQFRQTVGHTPQRDGIKAEPGRRFKKIDALRYKLENAEEEELRQQGRAAMLNSAMLDELSKE